MKTMIRIVPTLAALVLLTVPAVAAGPLSKTFKLAKLDPVQAVAGSVGEDRQLALRQADFLKFAETKVREMNRNHILSRERMRIDKRPDGLYRARFHEIDDASLACQVSRSQSNSLPYVAVLSYREKIYAASCATPEDCRQGQFLPVEVIPNRHIFVYNNGSWQ